MFNGTRDFNSGSKLRAAFPLGGVLLSVGFYALFRIMYRWTVERHNEETAESILGVSCKREENIAHGSLFGGRSGIILSAGF
jgi:hypothetical protein